MFWRDATVTPWRWGDGDAIHLISARGAEPDQATRAYLTVIARDPEGVQRALQPPSSGQTAVALLKG